MECNGIIVPSGTVFFELPEAMWQSGESSNLDGLSMFKQQTWWFDHQRCCEIWSCTIWSRTGI